MTYKPNYITIVETMNNDWVLYEIIDCTNRKDAINAYEVGMGVDQKHKDYKPPRFTNDESGCLYSQEIEGRACMFPITKLTP